MYIAIDYRYSERIFTCFVFSFTFSRPFHKHRGKKKGLDNIERLEAGSSRLVVVALYVHKNCCLVYLFLHFSFSFPL
jgi:hypothetical protein